LCKATGCRLAICFAVRRLRREVTYFDKHWHKQKTFFQRWAARDYWIKNAAPEIIVT